jgi:hypothetical protein
MDGSLGENGNSESRYRLVRQLCGMQTQSLLNRLEKETDSEKHWPGSISLNVKP